MELRELKGIGPKRLALLEQLHIGSLEELLLYYPCDYMDFQQLKTVSEMEDGQTATVELTVSSGPSYYSKGKLSAISLYGTDSKGKKLGLRFYNQPYRINQLPLGTHIFAWGRVKKGTRGAAVMVNPRLLQEAGVIRPLYHSVPGLPQATLQKCIAEALTLCPMPEYLPSWLREQYGLMGKQEAVETLHFPKSKEQLQQALRRSSFEQALYYFLYQESCREQGARQQGEVLRGKGYGERFSQKLSFPLTKAQRRVMEEINADLVSGFSMNRLLQGDVGSGKTAVAAYALGLAAECGYQGAFMAPTEILARQQYESLEALFPGCCGLLTGSLGRKERQQALGHIQDGSWRLVIGTHALFSEDVVFKNLAMIVTDEQHRFGVEQRSKLMQKGYRPHVLVMSATPIPRTLALLLYGDLSLSVLDELPPGRKEVKTHMVGVKKRRELFYYLGKEAKEDRRSYVVCPLIDAAEGYEGLSLEEVSKELEALLPDVPLTLLHGRMGEEEKQQVMESFRKGAAPILLSTTVIEVGIHVPEAAHMAIIGAERFGLSSLHQLRGRVGRGEQQSHCYLVAGKAMSKIPPRLQAMLDTADGFEIAQLDLDLRGAGELLGLRQSGESSMAAFLQQSDIQLLQQAKEAAGELYYDPREENSLPISIAKSLYGKPGSIAMN